MKEEFLHNFASDHGIPWNKPCGGWKLAAPIENLALEIGALALAGYSVSGGGTAEDLKALYVRPSDPELKNVRV